MANSDRHVRAKFRVTEIKTHMGSKRDSNGNYVPAEMRSVKLIPVVGTDGENKEFWDATPSGEISMGVINLEAALPFELNREFYVDFTPADTEKYLA